MKKQKKFLCVVALVLVLILALSGCGSSTDGDASTGKNGNSEVKKSEQYVLKICNSLGTTELANVYCEQMADHIGEKTDGKFVVEVYPNDELGPIKDCVETISRGGNLMVLCSTDFLSTYVPDFEILDCPFLFDGYKDFTKIQDSEWFAKKQAELSDQGIMLLNVEWYMGARHIAAVKPINSPEDMKGVQMRVAASPSRVALATSLGANPVETAWTETYSALNQKVVEACEAPIATMYNAKIHEVAPNISMTGHIQSILGINVSVEWWNNLPKEYQDVLLEEIQWVRDNMNKDIAEQENKMRETLTSEGATIIDVDVSAFREASKSAYDELSSRWTEGTYEEVSVALGH